MKEKISLSILGRGVVALSAVDHMSAQHGLVLGSTLVWQSCGECHCRCSVPLMFPPLVDGASFARS